MKSKPLSSLPLLLIAALVAAQPITGLAASASELLEKGIYTEETKGDIDGAIAIYQQIADEAKTARTLAARAQLRLGQCYLKKNRTTDANAAFEKLIREFPTEKELVATARKLLPAEITLTPVCWVDGERLTHHLTLATGIDIGVMELRSDLVEVDGRKVWRVGRRMSGGGESVSTVEVDPETFRPLSSYWKHTLLGEVTAVFKSDEVRIQRNDGKPATTLPLDKHVFDNEQCFNLLRRLPLQVGYKVGIPVVASIAGGTVIPLAVEVPVKETLEVPAGKFDCFKVVLNIGQTLWISDDPHRYFVKFEGGGAIGQLTSIAQRKPGDAVQFSDEALGVSFHAPADWVIWKATKGQPGKQVLIRTFDPTCDSSDGGMRLIPTDSLSAAMRASSRAWADLDLKRMGDEVKVRPESWKNLNVGGRLGVSCISDFKVNDKPQVQWLIYVLGPKTSEFFVISAPPEKFEALKSAFETVVTSYRMTK